MGHFEYKDSRFEQPPEISEGRRVIRGFRDVIEFVIVRMTALFAMKGVARCSCAAVDEWLSEGRGEICEIHLSPLRPQ